VKKMMSLFVAMVLVLSMYAYAEEKLTVANENLVVFSGDDTGYFYAKVINDTGLPVGVDSGALVIFSTDDEIVLAEDYVYTAPSYVILQPGDYLYIYKYLWDDALLDSEIGDYKFSIPIGNSSTEIVKVPCEATMDLKGVGSYDNYVYITFNNNTGEQVFEPYFVVAIYDQNENIVFTAYHSLTDVIVNENSSVTVRCYVGDEFMEHYATNNIIPTSIDAYVTYEKDVSGK